MENLSQYYPTQSPVEEENEQINYEDILVKNHESLEKLYNQFLDDFTKSLEFYPEGTHENDLMKKHKTYIDAMYVILNDQMETLQAHMQQEINNCLSMFSK